MRQFLRKVYHERTIAHLVLCGAALVMRARRDTVETPRGAWKTFTPTKCATFGYVVS